VIRIVSLLRWLPGLLLVVAIVPNAGAQTTPTERLDRAHADYLRSRRETIDLDALLTELERLADVFEAEGTDSLAIVAFNDAGDLHLRAGRLESSRALFERGLALASRAGRARDEADLRADLAVSWAMAGDFEGMIAATRDILPLARELEDRDLARRCWFNICVAYTKLGRTPDALVAVRRSLSLARELESVQRMASAFSMVSELQLSMGQVEMAWDSADSAVTYGRRFGDRLPLSAALLVRASSRAGLGGWSSGERRVWKGTCPWPC
jgi:tetratricopeptide (TPR) repeat protein